MDVNIDKERYIEELEQSIIFMCSWYNDLNKDIFKDYINKVNEKYEKLPTIQGLKNRMAVENIAKMENILKNGEDEFKYNFSFSNIEKQLKSKYVK